MLSEMQNSKKAKKPQKKKKKKTVSESAYWEKTRYIGRGRGSDRRNDGKVIPYVVEEL